MTGIDGAMGRPDETRGVSKNSAGAEANNTTGDTLNIQRVSELSKLPRESAWMNTPFRIATAGYSAPPDGYESFSQTLLDRIVAKLQETGQVGLVTSPTADKGSIDAITSLSAQRNKAPIRYVTCEDYVQYIQPDNFPAELKKDSFSAQPKYVLPDKELYSKATAEMSNVFMAFEGRDTTVGDMVNAIKAGNKVIIVDNEDHNPDLWDYDRSRPMDASEYIEAKVGGDGLLPWLADKGFDPNFLKEYEEQIKENLTVVNLDKSSNLEAAVDYITGKITGHELVTA